MVIAGILDLGLYYIADIDLTGWSFFPYVVTGVGWALIEIAKGKDDNNEDGDGNGNIIDAVTDIFDDIIN